MSCTMTSFFPTSPASPNAFSIFAQSPRETHATYEDLRHILRPSNGQIPTKKRSAPKSTPSPMSSTFSLFTPSQSPRDAYATYHDLREVLRPSNGQTYTKSTSGKLGLKKILGGI